MKRQASMRRAVPIMAYVGANGAGKTLAMMYDTMPTLRGMPWACEKPDHVHTHLGITRGERRVLSTVPIYEFEEGVRRLHRLYDPLLSWKQLLDAEHADVLLDEIAGVASARTHSAMPPQMVQLIVQLRKRDAMVRWTAPNWQRADVIIREVTQGVTVCRGYMGVRPHGELWSQKRFFIWSTYDAIDWEDYSLQRVERAKAICRQMFWRPGHEVGRTYSTYDRAETLDHISDTGVCMTCNGTRRRHTCNCEDSPRRRVRAVSALPSPIEADVSDTPE